MAELFSNEIMKPETEACESNSAETLKAAASLLSPLGASFEHPGFINVNTETTNFAFGCTNGPFGYDYGPVDDEGFQRQSHNEELEETATPEQLAVFVLRIVGRYGKGQPAANTPPAAKPAANTPPAAQAESRQSMDSRRVDRLVESILRRS